MQALLKSVCASVISRSGLPTFHRIHMASRPFYTPNLSLHTIQVRNASFFNRLSADDLWKSVTMVSNAGMKRGRGRKTNPSIMKNLYAGKKMGSNKTGMVWPGLNSPVLQGKNIMQRHQVEVAEEQKETQLKRKRQKVHALDRGYSGGSALGCKLDPQPHLPSDFEYRIVDMNSVCHMDGVYGRVQSTVCLIVCGNGTGVIGIGRGKNRMFASAANTAAARSVKRLIHVERYKNHTVLHDFFSQYYRTKLFVKKVPEGYGLRAHRVIRTMCKLIGIKDIHVKVEGSTFNLNVVKAFVLGLVRQRSYQSIADEKGLHIVELDKQARNLPTILASPEKCRNKEEISSSEILDFNQITDEGKVRLVKKKPIPYYMRLPGYQRYLEKYEYKRGEKECEYELLAEYGTLKSFLAEKYPECINNNYLRKNEVKEVE